MQFVKVDQFGVHLEPRKYPNFLPESSSQSGQHNAALILFPERIAPRPPQPVPSTALKLREIHAIVHVNIVVNPCQIGPAVQF